MSLQGTDVTLNETALLTATPIAVAKIKNLLAEKNLSDHSLRVFVTGGGCRGLQYGMAFEKDIRPSDRVIEVDGIRLVVDDGSALYLQGSNIDFVDTLMGGGFRIDNPNALSTCGCGQSFRTGQDKGTAHSCGCH